MNHQASTEDQAFRRAFEALAVVPADFDHAAHVRLAYVYLCELSPQAAADRMKRSLLAFLDHLGVDQSKYHETMTRAWILAVSHFMARSECCISAAVFTQRNPELLDSKIMLTHYSAAVLFSADARKMFVPPDIQSIPPQGRGAP